MTLGQRRQQHEPVLRSTSVATAPLPTPPSSWDRGMAAHEQTEAAIGTRI
jgi:hypothetical protein